MNYAVSIRRNADGAIRTCHFDGEWEGEMDEYMWTDGNYGCDCNRHLFFTRAADNNEDEERDCGETAYTVTAVTLPSGEVVWRDDKPEPRRVAS